MLWWSSAAGHMRRESSQSPVEQGVLRPMTVGGRCLAGAMDHPLLATVAAIDAALDQAAGVDPIYLTTTEKQQALTGCCRLEARIAAIKLRVLACADDIAEATGDRSTAHWLATTTRDHPGTLRR